MKVPLSISVVIPAFNASTYIARCIQSCLMQDEVSEIIIIDDGSTDATTSIVKALAEQDPRVKLYHHPKLQNLGRSASRNLGIKKSTSEWITFCDADDYFLKDRFKAFVLIEKEGLAGTYEHVLSEYSTPSLKQSTESLTGLNQSPTPDLLQDYLISHRNERISIISLIIRRSALEDLDLFDESLQIGEDTDFIWRLSGKRKLLSIVQSSPKVIRQVHEGNTYQNKDTHFRDHYNLYAKWNTQVEQLKLSETATRRIKSSYQYYKFLKTRKEAHPLIRPLVRVTYIFSTLFTTREDQTKF